MIGEGMIEDQMIGELMAGGMTIGVQMTEGQTTDVLSIADQMREDTMIERSMIGSQTITGLRISIKRTEDGMAGMMLDGNLGMIGESPELEVVTMAVHVTAVVMLSLIGVMGTTVADRIMGIVSLIGLVNVEKLQTVHGRGLGRDELNVDILQVGTVLNQASRTDLQRCCMVLLIELGMEAGMVEFTDRNFSKHHLLAPVCGRTQLILLGCKDLSSRQLVA